MQKILIKNIEILSQGWSTLKKYTYDYLTTDGNWQTHVREAYDRRNGITILLYNKEKNTVLLTKQFRLPTYLNGLEDGMLIETCAGKLEDENPEDGMIREIEEETGYRLPSVEKVFEIYMSPGSVTEKLFFYIGKYDESMKVSKGGGLESEQENIEVLELNFPEAKGLLDRGKIMDAKTVILLQHALLKKLLKE